MYTFYALASSMAPLRWSPELLLASAAPLPRPKPLDPGSIAGIILAKVNGMTLVESRRRSQQWAAGLDKGRHRGRERRVRSGLLI